MGVAGSMGVCWDLGGFGGIRRTHGVHRGTWERMDPGAIFSFLTPWKTYPPIPPAPPSINITSSAPGRAECWHPEWPVGWGFGETN